jgi:replicative DNA helicase
MGANIEHQLLCRIIHDQDFHTVQKLKIDESCFLTDSQTKEVFRFIRDHYHNEMTFGSVPSWQILQSRFYGFPWAPSYDTLPTLCSEIKRQKLTAEILSLQDEILQSVNVDPLAALDRIREAAIRLTSENDTQSNDMLMSASYEKLYSEYNTLANQGGLVGIPWPWQLLNDDTQGIQDGQFIIIYGRPKNMKSWLALVIAAYAYKLGMRVLFWSLEMEEIMVIRRVAALLTCVDYGKWKGAKLDPATRDQVFQAISFMKAEEQNQQQGTHSPAFLAVRPRGKGSGISALHAKIREFQPDVVFVDAMYRMRDDRQNIRTIDWKAIAHISQDLKDTAALFQVPVFGITQANRGANKDPKKSDMDEVAYSDALAQDCDLCIRVSKQIDQATHEPELVLSFPGARETALEAFVIHGIPATNFSFKRHTVQDPNAPQQPQQQQGGGGSKGGGGRGGGNQAPILPAYGR